MTAHREPAYAARRVSLPVSEQASDGSLMLPLFATMTDEQVDTSVARLLEAVDRVGAGDLA